MKPPILACCNFIPDAGNLKATAGLGAGPV
jgi:hypothetical protein